MKLVFGLRRALHLALCATVVVPLLAVVVASPVSAAEIVDPPRPENHMSPGQQLYGAGPFAVKSPNKQYQLFQGPDGNFFESGNAEGVTPFESGTSGNPGAVTIMQRDGNLVTYAADQKTALFNTHTEGNPGAYASLQDDSNLVIYSSDGTRVLWAAFGAADQLVSDTRCPCGRGTLINTAPGVYQYVISRDYHQIALFSGNQLFVGGATTGATFASPFSSVPGDGCYLTLQGDGNLVIYPSGVGSTIYTTKPAVWSTRTEGNPGARVVMQNDGNFVLYAPSGRPLWSSKYGRTY